MSRSESLLARRCYLTDLPGPAATSRLRSTRAVRCLRDRSADLLYHGQGSNWLARSSETLSGSLSSLQQIVLQRIHDSRDIGPCREALIYHSDGSDHTV